MNAILQYALILDNPTRQIRNKLNESRLENMCSNLKAIDSETNAICRHYRLKSVPMIDETEAIILN